MTVAITAAADGDDDGSNTNKKVTFKNCATFTNYISWVNNAQVDDAHDIVM